METFYRTPIDKKISNDVTKFILIISGQKHWSKNP